MLKGSVEKELGQQPWERAWEAGFLPVPRSVLLPTFVLHPQRTGDLRQFGAFVDLLGLARYGDGDGLRRGEVAIGTRKLAKRWGVHRTTVGRWIRNWEGLGVVTREQSEDPEKPQRIRVKFYETYTTLRAPGSHPRELPERHGFNEGAPERRAPPPTPGCTPAWYGPETTEWCTFSPGPDCGHAPPPEFASGTVHRGHRNLLHHPGAPENQRSDGRDAGFDPDPRTGGSTRRCTEEKRDHITGRVDTDLDGSPPPDPDEDYAAFERWAIQDVEREETACFRGTGTG
jgi:hypothetical protein